MTSAPVRGFARALFIYWNVPAAHAAAAIGAARALQAALAADHPGLEAQLFRRADDAQAHAGTVVTVMETYALPADRPAGIGADLQAAIAAAAATALSAPHIGKRHVEVFDRLPR